MITKVTNETRPLYNALFEEADKVLNNTEDDDKIAGLDDYFSRITDIVTNAGAGLEQKPRLMNYEKRRFLALPFSEGYFEVDANTRIIKIPDSFAKNGLSVQGDQIAETLYFKIDRYFDHQDFGNMDDNDLIIGVQWKNTVGDEHFSKADFIDIYSHPGYVVFNWDINNEITRNAGPISFSVRIYKIDPDTQSVIYSFSTLTATSFISNALDYDVNSLAEGTDMNDLVIRRLTNSPAPNAGGEALPPFIVERFPDVLDLNPVTGQRQLAVQATSQDGGRLSYVWMYRPLGGATDGTFTGASNPKNYMITSDETFQEGNDYYVPTTGNGTSAYRLLIVNNEYDVGENIADWIESKDDINQVYELFATAIAERTGLYTVEVKNRQGGATNSVMVGPCTIPGPSTFIVTSDSSIEGNFLSSGRKLLVLTTTSNAPYETPDTFKTEWKDITDPENPVVVATNSASYIVGGDDGIPSGQRALYDHTFQSTTVACRNGDESAVPVVKTFRVTADPRDSQYAPQLVLTDENVTVSSPTDTKTVTVNIVNDSEINSDNYTYQWYKDLGNTGINTEENDDIALPGEIYPSIILGETNPNITATGIGNWYYCKVTNHLNGEIKTVYSNSVKLNKSY